MTKWKKKLASWKGNLLSLGGRLTLLKASLANLPLYYLSIFPIPKGVTEKIVRIQRQFLWCGSLGQKFLAPVSWDSIKHPKAMGGLGVGDIQHKNLGLLCKWLWRLLNDNQSLWCGLVRNKYNYGPSFTLGDIAKPSKGGTWRGICAALLNNQ